MLHCPLKGIQADTATQAMTYDGEITLFKLRQVAGIIYAAMAYLIVR